MIAVTLEHDLTKLEKARSEIFAALDRCPCCGAERTDRSKSRALQNVEFQCDAIFYRLAGSPPAVSRPCAGPSYAAVKGLEVEAAKAAKAVVS
jgi:hypothetical protein